MTRTTITKKIDAPIGDVFRTVAEINRFSKAIPHITKVEFLSEAKTGAGTTFRETRLMRGKEVSTVLEITEYIENDHVRLVADSHGTVWDSLFTVEPDEDLTRLTLVMDATPKTFMSKLTVPLFRRLVAKAIEKDMDAVKAFCEGSR